MAILNAGENVKQPEFLCIAGGNQKDIAALENSLAVTYHTTQHSPY